MHAALGFVAGFVVGGTAVTIFYERILGEYDKLKADIEALITRVEKAAKDLKG